MHAPFMPELAEQHAPVGSSYKLSSRNFTECFSYANYLFYNRSKSYSPAGTRVCACMLSA